MRAVAEINKKKKKKKKFLSLFLRLDNDGFITIPNL